MVGLIVRLNSTSPCASARLLPKIALLSRALLYRAVLRWTALPLAALLCTVAAPAVQAQTTYNVPGSTDLNSPAPTSISVTVTFQQAGTVSAVRVVTEGITGLDYADVSGACSGFSFTVGGTCSETITFAPKAPGVRHGAVVLLDGSNNVLGTAFVNATATGPMGMLVPGIITTVAGDGTRLYNGDSIQATNASLLLPFSVVVDAAGNLYIADSVHNRIREVNATTGIITTVAGDGNAGITGDGGLATSANLNFPAGLAIDGAGNLYIADSNIHVIRRVDAVTGIITTVAGVIGNPGYTGDGGAATSAELNTPEGIALDNNGNLYIADSLNNCIREVNATTGIITTVAGNGTADFSGDGGLATAAELNNPLGVAVATTGDFYIADTSNNRIREVNATTGIITTVAGNGTAGYTASDDANINTSAPGAQATAAKLNKPVGIAIDPAGNLYIADSTNNRVRKVTNGIISTIAGNGASTSNGDHSTATVAGLYAPYALAQDGNGNLYIADYTDGYIRKVSSNTTSFAYAAIREGNVSSPQLALFENDGTASLNISGYQTTNAQVDAGKTTCSTVTPLTTAGPGNACILGADFAPTTTGNPVSGSISIASDAVNTPDVIALSGPATALDPTTTTVASSKSTSATNSAITLTATVVVTPPGMHAPTGTVKFYDNGGTLLGTATLQSSTAVSPYTSVYTLTTATLTAGTHSITAVFAGDTYDNTSTSAPVFKQVVQDATSLSISSNLNPSQSGQAVTFTATLVDAAGGTPTGNITFYDGNTALRNGGLNASGIATFSTSALTVGTHTIKGVYAGDATSAGSTSPVLTQTVSPSATSSTTLAASPSTSNAGATVTFTATVTPTSSNGGISGTVTFSQGSTALQILPVTASGVVVWTTNTLSVGTHSILATFSGNTNYAGSSSAPVVITVQQATAAAALTTSGSPSTAGKPVTFTATLTSNGGTPAGSVVFADNGKAISSAMTLNSSGMASYTTAALAVGTHGITAVYAGNVNDSAATSNTVSQVVSQAPTTTLLSANASSVQTLVPVTFTITVSSGTSITPTGAVVLKDGATQIGTATLASGKATITVPSLSAGQHPLVAVYGGDTQDLTSSSAALTEAVQLRPTTSSLSVSSASLASNQQLTLISVVQGTGPVMPTGTVVFSSGSTTLGSGTLDANGVATYSLTPGVGNYNVVAIYQGDGVYAGSTSGAAPVAVGQATAFTLNLSSSAVTVQSKQYTQVKLTLASLQNFTDTLSLGCAGLPAGITCTFSQDPVDLAANGTQSVLLTVDSGSPLTAGGTAHNDPAPGNGIVFAFVPGILLTGLLLRRSRTLRQTLGGLLLVLLFCGSIALSGCGTIKVNGAPPGTYLLQVTAVGTKTGVSQSAALTLKVTQ